MTRREWTEDEVAAFQAAAEHLSRLHKFRGVDGAVKLEAITTAVEQMRRTAGVRDPKGWLCRAAERRLIDRLREDNDRVPLTARRCQHDWQRPMSGDLVGPFYVCSRCGREGEKDLRPPHAIKLRPAYRRTTLSLDTLLAATYEDADGVHQPRFELAAADAPTHCKIVTAGGAVVEPDAEASAAKEYTQRDRIIAAALVATGGDVTDERLGELAGCSRQEAAKIRKRFEVDGRSDFDEAKLRRDVRRFVKRDREPEAVAPEAAKLTADLADWRRRRQDAQRQAMLRLGLRNLRR